MNYITPAIIRFQEIRLLANLSGFKVHLWYIACIQSYHTKLRLFKCCKAIAFYQHFPILFESTKILETVGVSLGC